MESGKGHQEEEEEMNEEFGSKKDVTVCNNDIKDGRNSDKANAVRSKHSVTEQRRRSKINERFQILRKLIPQSDQKRDTASFLLEVIQYVQYLQENVQKYEGSYQPCSSEPTKLMPWRNTHWNVQSVAGQPQNMTNGAGPGSIFTGRFDSNSVVAVPTAMQSGQENPIESNAIRDASCRSIDSVTEVRNRPMSTPMPLQTSLPVSIANNGAFSGSLPKPASDAQSTECPTSVAAADGLNGHDELTIEEEQSTFLVFTPKSVDLSQASISVQINLGKRANRRPTPRTSTAKDHDMPTPAGNQPVRPFQDSSNSENLDQSQKKLKI